MSSHAAAKGSHSRRQSGQRALREAGDAEFGITVRAAAMGRGFSSFAMKEMIRIGLEEEKLQKITDKYIAEVDKAIEAKSKEIMTV